MQDYTTLVPYYRFFFKHDDNEPNNWNVLTFWYVVKFDNSTVYNISKCHFILWFDYYHGSKNPGIEPVVWKRLLGFRIIHEESLRMDWDKINFLFGFPIFMEITTLVTCNFFPTVKKSIYIKGIPVISKLVFLYFLSMYTLVWWFLRQILWSTNI